MNKYTEANEGFVSRKLMHLSVPYRMFHIVRASKPLDWRSSTNIRRSLDLVAAKCLV